MAPVDKTPDEQAVTSNNDDRLRAACLLVAQLHDDIRAVNRLMRMPTFEDTFPLQLTASRLERAMDRVCDDVVAVRGSGS